MALERTATATGVGTVDLVLREKNNCTELARTPVEGERQWRQNCCQARMMLRWLAFFPHISWFPMLGAAPADPFRQLQLAALGRSF